MHPFDQSLLLTAVDGELLRGESPLLYWNMVGPFGGMTAAIVLSGVTRQPTAIGEPLVLTVNYCGPLSDNPFDLHVHCARSNKSTQHWHVELTQHDTQSGERKCVVQALVVMGIRRDDWRIQTASVPDCPPASQCERRRGREDIVWFDRFDLRLTCDPLTDQSPDSPVMTWARDDPPRPLDYLSLTNMCDTAFPAIFAHRQGHLPIATVSLNIYFHTRAAELTSFGEEFLLGVAKSNIFHDGFGDCEAMMWAGERLIATTHQTMWYRTE